MTAKLNPKRRLGTIMKNLVGKRFNRLKILSLHSLRPTKWMAECNCGKIIVVKSGHLGNGHTQSCGCIASENVSKRNTKHGMSKKDKAGIQPREYRIWKGIKTRCLNHNFPKYESYGGRGIKICKRWMRFENFYKDMGKCPEDMSIERMDNDKGYSKSNCKWATRIEQTNNTRRNVRIYCDGVTLTASQWGIKVGVRSGRIRDRLRLGWPAELAIKAPFNHKLNT